jgi:hypothetical protein
MITIGVDFHPEFQQIASVDTETGEFQERRLAHREEAENFYRALVTSEPGWYGSSSTRAKWRALPSARTSTLEICLTPPTLSERRFLTSYGHGAPEDCRPIPVRSGPMRLHSGLPGRPGLEAGSIPASPPTAALSCQSCPAKCGRKTQSRRRSGEAHFSCRFRRTGSPPNDGWV